MMFSKRFVLLAFLASFLTMQNGCIYEPEPAAQPGTISSEDNPLKSINGGIQTCNPSISQNETHFQGCMMWLSLGEVSVDTSLVSGYNIEGARQHDRITISDQSNRVRWYIKGPDFIDGSEMQDPEWSNHNDYAAFLGQMAGNLWHAFAIRISDKTAFKLHNRLSAAATPFVWVHDAGPDMPPDSNATLNESSISKQATFTSENVADSSSVAQFFGTNMVKVAWSASDGTYPSIFFIDYSKPSPSVKMLKRPNTSFTLESPIISPNGEWVTYQAVQGNAPKGAYVQKLDENALPYSVGAIATEPHWWRHPNDTAGLYVVYATDRFVTQNLTLDLADGSLGSTFLTKFSPPLTDEDAGKYGSLVYFDSPRELVGLPMQGGLSRSGRYLCTGYEKAYIFDRN